MIISVSSGLQLRFCVIRSLWLPSRLCRNCPFDLVCKPTRQSTYALLTPAKAFYDRDPVDVALDWAPGESTAIPVIMPANDKRPGGDWEAGRLTFWIY